ncbi:MAG: phage tail tape measure protein [Paracoccaceae bacterium]
MNPEVVLKIDALDNTKAAFNSVKKNLGGLEKTTSSFRSRIESLQPTFQRMATVGTVATAALSAGIGMVVKQAADMEQAEIAFSTMLGSMDRAKNLIAEIQAFGAVTPFETTELLGATRSLLAYGVEAENVKTVLGQIGDVAAGTNQPIGELASLFGKMKSQQIIFTEDLNQLADRGIPILDLLAEKYQTNVVGIREMASTGKLSFADVEAALASMTAEGGLFFNMMDNQSATAAGRWSTLRDEVQQTAVTLGTAFLPIVKSVTDSLIPLMERLSDWITANPELARNLVIAAGAIAGVVAVVGTLGLLLPPIIGGFALLAAGIGALSLPIIAITALLGVIGVTMFNLWKNWDESWTSIKWAASNAWEWIRDKAIDPMIQGFEKVLRFIERVRDGLKSIGAKVGSSISSAGSSISRLLGSVTPFADGGIVTKPTLGLVGEAGPEAIIPLSKAGALGGGGITINIAGTFMDDRAAARRMGDEIMNTLKQQMRL